MGRHDYQTNTVDGAEAFERARAEDHDYFDRYVEADFYEEPEPEEGDDVQTFGGVKVRTARRDHKDGTVKAGDRYAVATYGGYTVGGPRWLTVQKVVLRAGAHVPGWLYNNARHRGGIYDEE